MASWRAAAGGNYGEFDDGGSREAAGELASAISASRQQSSAHPHPHHRRQRSDGGGGNIFEELLAERRYLLERHKQKEEIKRKSFYKGRYRYFLFGLAFLHTLCSSGIVLGWAALATLLYQRGLYLSYCSPLALATASSSSSAYSSSSSSSSSPPSWLSARSYAGDEKNSQLIIGVAATSLNSSTIDDSGGEGEGGGGGSSDPLEWCYDQQVRLALIYALGLMGMYASRAAFGWFMDTFGAKRTTVVGSIVLGLGALLFMIALDQDVDFYPYAFGMIGIGGGAIHMTCLQFANLFPGYEGLMTSVLYGSFQAGSAVLFAFKFMEDWLRFDLRISLLGLIGVAIFCFATGILFWPNRPFVRLYASQDDTIDVLVSEDDEEILSNDDDFSNDDAYLSHLSLWQMMLSPEFLFILVFSCVHLLRFDFLVGTILPQIHFTKHVTNTDQLSQRVDAWSVTLACGSLAFLGAHYCVQKRGFNLTFTLANVFSLIYGILALFPLNWSTFAPMLLFFSITRQFVCISTVGYLESVFGLRYHESLQRILAVAMTGVAAAQFPLISVGFEVMAGHIERLNFLLLLGVILCFAYLLVMCRKPVEGDDGEEVPACSATWWRYKWCTYP